MSEKLKQTKAMLAKHHRDGPAFAELMKETFHGRFNDEYWASWDKWVAPVLGEGSIVLDLGTGPGLYLKEVTARYPKVKAIGIECADYMLDSIEEGEVIEADLHDPHFPLEDNSVDAVNAAVVFHELHQPLLALKEVARTLKPGGRLVVMDWVRVPLEQYLAGQEVDVFADSTTADVLEDTFIHFIEHNRFSAEDLAFMLERCGFRVLEKVMMRENQYARLVAEKC